MLVRHGWLAVWVLCLGCHSLVALEIDGEAAPPVPSGRPQPAAAAAEQPPAAEVNHLDLAAARLEAGDDAGACAHLARHVAAHPEHLTARGHYAELLLRLK